MPNTIKLEIDNIGYHEAALMLVEATDSKTMDWTDCIEVRSRRCQPPRRPCSAAL
jgi:hypothetical protein